jgi:FixJ family two-component response regulator
MPGRTGVQLVRIVKERWPSIVAVLLTGMDEADGEIREAETDGTLHSRLGKPLPPSELIKAMYRAVRAAAIAKEPASGHAALMAWLRSRRD